MTADHKQGGIASIFALIDCNNFFVSCERLFRPDLEGKPVVVLSSGDGCAVARSNEAKLLDIPMGAPAFQYRDLFRVKNVVQFSANFELYGNISRRITQILTQICPCIEVYSVDESFLDLSQLAIADYAAWGREVRARILREVGVPVSVGIAPSKTLAKLASETAKHDDMHADQPYSREHKNPARNESFRGTGLPIELDMAAQGVVNLVGCDPEFLEHSLAAMPIRDVWGVGRKLAPKLQAEGVGNALALARMRPQYAQKIMGIHGRQLVEELNGVSCHPLELEGKVAKSILRSRTFGEDTGELYVLEAAIASLAASAAFGLRRAGLLARTIGIFITTNRHKPGYRQWKREITLGTPTSDSGRIIRLLVDELQDLHSGTQQYHRLGIYLNHLVPADALQTDMLGFVDVGKHDAATARMAAIDQINRRHGRDKIRFAAADLAQSWQPKRRLRSPHYVSNWAELPTAKIVSDD